MATQSERLLHSSEGTLFDPSKISIVLLGQAVQPLKVHSHSVSTSLSAYWTTRITREEGPDLITRRENFPPSTSSSSNDNKLRPGPTYLSGTSGSSLPYNLLPAVTGAPSTKPSTECYFWCGIFDRIIREYNNSGSNPIIPVRRNSTLLVNLHVGTNAFCFQYRYFYHFTFHNGIFTPESLLSVMVFLYRKLPQ